MRPKTLDHVALWTDERQALGAFLVRELGVHVIDEQAAFTLLGSDARRGKLTLFDAQGPREAGALKHVALRVSTPVTQRELSAPGGLALRLVQAETDVEYDLDHVALISADPETTAREYLRLGFAAADPGPEGVPRVEVGGAWVEFHRGDPGAPERPLLNHLAVLVDAVQEHVDGARERGIEIDREVDAANTLAVFLRGPEHVLVEYVEHKPTFSLT